MRMADRALCQHMTPDTAAYALALAEGSHPQLKLPNEPAPEPCRYAEMDEFQVRDTASLTAICIQCWVSRQARWHHDVFVGRE